MQSLYSSYRFEQRVCSWIFVQTCTGQIVRECATGLQQSRTSTDSDLIWLKNLDVLPISFLSMQSQTIRVYSSTFVPSLNLQRSRQLLCLAYSDRLLRMHVSFWIRTILGMNILLEENFAPLRVECVLCSNGIVGTATVGTAWTPLQPLHHLKAAYSASISRAETILPQHCFPHSSAYENIFEAFLS